MDQHTVVITNGDDGLRVVECPDEVRVFVLDYTTVNEEGTDLEGEAVDEAIDAKDWPRVAELLDEVELRVSNARAG